MVYGEKGETNGPGRPGAFIQGGYSYSDDRQFPLLKDSPAKPLELPLDVAENAVPSCQEASSRNARAETSLEWQKWLKGQPAEDNGLKFVWRDQNDPISRSRPELPH